MVVLQAGACLRSSDKWSKVEIFSLITNMRVNIHNDIDSGHYAEKLFQIDDERLDTDAEGCILL